MGLHQTKKLLCSKGNNQQSEKTTCGMEENNVSQNIYDRGLISKNIRNSYNSVAKNTHNLVKNEQRTSLDISAKKT